MGMQHLLGLKRFGTVRVRQKQKEEHFIRRQMRTNGLVGIRSERINSRKRMHG